jgi:peptide/nickel transport system ATP-binding protein
LTARTAGPATEQAGDDRAERRVAGPLLEVRDLRVVFTQYEAGLRRRRLEVISGIDLRVEAGTLVAVVGSSGSGKSLLAHAVLGVLPQNADVSGQILYRGEPLTEARLRSLRGGEICLVPQTVAALDPVTRVGRQVVRAAQLARVADPGTAAQRALRRLELPGGTDRRFAHQLSGGMARRVLTATATVGRPHLVLADEPTPGLHPAVVAETLRGLRSMADDGAAVVLITHDLLGALGVADAVAVFYAGTTVEVAPADRFTGDGSRLRHPYSRALWAALPGHGFTPLAGAQPPPTDLPPGCLFAPRCPVRSPECEGGRPQARQLGGALVRCIRD